MLSTLRRSFQAPIKARIYAAASLTLAVPSATRISARKLSTFELFRGATIRGKYLDLNQSSCYGVQSTRTRGFHETNQVPPATGLSRNEYIKLSDVTMEAIYDAIDSYAEKNEGVDVEYSSGVLTVFLPNGTYVINKQPPNKQIWLSSPVSGPFQYKWDAEVKKWVDIRGGNESLDGLIARELGIVFDIGA